MRGRACVRVFVRACVRVCVCVRTRVCVFVRAYVRVCTSSNVVSTCGISRWPPVSFRVAATLYQPDFFGFSAIIFAATILAVSSSER